MIDLFIASILELVARKEYWSPLTQAEYEDGRDRRLEAEDIEPKAWYCAAQTDPPFVNCYAVEVLVEAKSIRPIDDLFVMEIYLLDADGKKVGNSEQALIKPDGLIVEPGNPKAEGYLLDANEKLGLGPLAVNETVLLQL